MLFIANLLHISREKLEVKCRDDKEFTCGCKDASRSRLTPRSRAIHETPTGTRLAKKFRAFHFYIDKRPPSDPILSQSNALHASSFDFLKICFNIIITSNPQSSKASLSISPCVIFGGHSSTEAGFDPSTSVFPCQSHSTIAPS